MAQTQKKGSQWLSGFETLLGGGVINVKKHKASVKNITSRVSVLGKELSGIIQSNINIDISQPSQKGERTGPEAETFEFDPNQSPEIDPTLITTPSPEKEPVEAPVDITPAGKAEEMKVEESKRPSGEQALRLEEEKSENIPFDRAEDAEEKAPLAQKSVEKEKPSRLMKQLSLSKIQEIQKEATLKSSRDLKKQPSASTLSASEKPQAVPIRSARISMKQGINKISISKPIGDKKVVPAAGTAATSSGTKPTRDAFKAYLTSNTKK